jgi:hypothetical protein
MNARWLRTSRLSETETGRGDADRDRHSWLQRHSWGVRDGRNERLEPATRKYKHGDKARLDLLQLIALAGARQVGLNTSMLGARRGEKKRRPKMKRQMKGRTEWVELVYTQ